MRYSFIVVVSGNGALSVSHSSIRGDFSDSPTRKSRCLGIPKDNTHTFLGNSATAAEATTDVAASAESLERDIRIGGDSEC